MTIRSILLAGLGGLALASTPAAAQTMDRESWQQWQEMRNSAVSAESMMTGDVTNGFNMLGNVEDLILNASGTQVQYILYDIPFPYSHYGSDKGFVAWDNIAVERGAGTGLDLRIDSEESAYAKDELKLTRAQGERRMVSKIIGSDVRFNDGQMREVEDILFDPDTGMLTHYVVQFDNETLFGDDPRRIPASMVSIHSNGTLSIAQPVTYDYEVWIL